MDNRSRREFTSFLIPTSEASHRYTLNVMQIARSSKYHSYWTEGQFTDWCSLIAISGLGGHAFGSFKKKNGSHMWLRDSLPTDLPETRILVYGYDTHLFKSESFQNIKDLGIQLRNSINTIRSCLHVSHKPNALSHLTKLRNRTLSGRFSFSDILLVGSSSNRFERLPSFSESTWNNLSLGVDWDAGWGPRR